MREYAPDLTTPLRISEWMHAGLSGEFIELTKLGSIPIDLSGWSINEAAAIPGAFPIGAIGILAPGESAIVTERPTPPSAWRGVSRQACVSSGNWAG